MNILSSDYFKELYRLKTYHEVIDEIYNQVDHVEPWMTGNCRGPSTAICLLYKFFTMKLTVKQMHGLLKHKDSPYIRAVILIYPVFHLSFSLLKLVYLKYVDQKFILSVYSFIQFFAGIIMQFFCLCVCTFMQILKSISMQACILSLEVCSCLPDRCFITFLLSFILLLVLRFTAGSLILTKLNLLLSVFFIFIFFALQFDDMSTEVSVDRKKILSHIEFISIRNQ